jgi:Tol biopolymer transport system component
MEPLGAPDIAIVANPALSPDGRMLALSKVTAGNWDIWLIDARGAMRRLTSDPALDFFPVWSDDSRRVIFQSTRGKAADLYMVAANGEGAEELLWSDERAKSPADVSPNGQVLLYSSSAPGASADLWLLPLTGDRTPRPFVQTRGDDRDGQFSPDGKWVAYQSNHSGRAEIYLQPFPGPGDPVQVSVNGGTQVRWGRRGLELLYVGADQRMMSVAVSSDATGGSARLAQPMALFRTPFDPSVLQGRQQYVVSGDNQRFLVNTPIDAAAPSPIVVMLNWKGR